MTEKSCNTIICNTVIDFNPRGVFRTLLNSEDRAFHKKS